jgi:hypothetical protein
MRGKISSINKYRKFKRKLLEEYSDDSGIRRGLVEFVHLIPEERIEEYIRKHSLKPEGPEDEEMFDVNASGPARTLFYIARLSRRKMELSELEHAAECFFGRDKKYEMYQAICVAQAMNVIKVSFRDQIYPLSHAMEIEIKEDNDWRN